MTPISSPIPFAQWGIDLVTDLPPASGGRRSLVVAVDYFTKWAEAEAMASTTQEQLSSYGRISFAATGSPWCWYLIMAPSSSGTV